MACLPAGSGLANLLCSALVVQGMTIKEARSSVYMFDINGLLESSRTDLVDFQLPYAHKHAPTIIGVSEDVSLKSEQPVPLTFHLCILQR